MVSYLQLLIATISLGTSMTIAFHYPHTTTTTNFANNGNHNNRNSRTPVLLQSSSLKTNQEDDHTEPNIENGHQIQRRSFHQTVLLSVTAASLGFFSPLTLLPSSSHATESTTTTSTEMTTYQDDACGFKFDVPASWKQTEQTLPDRRRIVFFVDPEKGVEGDSNLVFVAYTPIRDDFTSLGSFGSVDQVAQQTILPKGELAGQSSDDQMLSAEDKKSAYFFDYVSKPAGQPKRHFRTIFTLAQGATGGAGSVLVSITAQTLESRYEALKPLYDTVVNSYGKSK